MPSLSLPFHSSLYLSSLLYLLYSTKSSSNSPSLSSRRIFFLTPINSERNHPNWGAARLIRACILLGQRWHHGSTTTVGTKFQHESKDQRRVDRTRAVTFARLEAENNTVYYWWGGTDGYYRACSSVYCWSPVVCVAQDWLVFTHLWVKASQARYVSLPTWRRLMVHPHPLGYIQYCIF